MCVCDPGHVQLVGLKFWACVFCIHVKIKKVSWEMRGNVNYSCNTHYRLADSNTPGCSRAAIVAKEVT